VLTSSRHMLDLLDNVLDLSKLGNQKMLLNEQSLNLLQLCEEVHMLLAPTIKHGVRFLLGVDPGLCGYSRTHCAGGSCW
jgi:signal transduction histidine kinase